MKRTNQNQTHEGGKRPSNYVATPDAGFSKDYDTVPKTTTSVRVKVTPGASKELIRVVGEYALEIFVREPAQKNLANKRVCELVAEKYGAPIKSAHIENGHRSRNKIIRITI
jgi:uncharacterized protein YggU (UPF0235/DUF167 family)